MKKTQVIVIHGGETFETYDRYIAFLRDFKIDDLDSLKSRRWKDVLPERLGEGFQIIYPQMPCSWNAKYLEWKIWFDKMVPYFGDGTLFIGISLGGIFLAKYFAENEYSKQVRGIFLVGPPYEPVNADDSLADFVLPADMSRLAEYGDRVHLYQSEDDPIVPFSHLAKYTAVLPKARVRIFKDRGHFLIPEFPEIVADIKAVV